MPVCWSMLVDTCVLMGCFALSGCSDSGTTYAPSYSEQHFQVVQLGMQSNDVVRLLGRPMRVDHISALEQWSYERLDESQQSDTTHNLVNSGKLQESALVVSFDGAGRVITSPIEELFGKDRSGVERELGKPTRITLKGANTILSYTLGTYSGSHEVRAVLLNESGIVVGKKAFYYHD